ncbi:Acetyltransferase (isoleucine patch superfamily) [Rathayibacter oskolensis]|uniref:Acetyltransferase (Isoleucine patch superfamily) n=1 Tax=Rathayibacter oskolensis TaxID=1891671 RepID=A0A1X7NAX5_9MICO|nr:CatB-related O-acetyltransferase [Rathayibacter oskolensis]SMH34761.1 Acetyltransferase (isoleucine patch superfamily) [Rathayibacter oskolensis]
MSEAGFTMTTDPLAAWLARHYAVLPKKSAALRVITSRENGAMYSNSLREVLRSAYGVDVGAYSYGSLLTPGSADRHTTIGRYVSIGPNVRRFGASHPMDHLSLHPIWYNPRLSYVDAGADVERTPCEIADEAWLGANVIIVPGCRRIGVGAVVSAGAVVTKDVPDFAVVGGSPAKLIKMRLEEPVRQALLKERPWDLDPAEADALLKEIAKRFDAPNLHSGR